MNKKIYKVIVSLQPYTALKSTVKEIDAVETNKTYTFGSANNKKVLKKSKIGVIDSILLNTIPTIMLSYHIICMLMMMKIKF